MRELLDVRRQIGLLREIPDKRQRKAVPCAKARDPRRIAAHTFNPMRDMRIFMLWNQNCFDAKIIMHSLEQNYGIEP
jgi:hypothetical protein